MTAAVNADAVKKSEITGKQMLAAQALATGATIKKAAEIAGVTDRTVKNWRKEEAFRAVLSELQDDAIQTTSRYLATATRAAAAVLVDVMSNRTLEPANAHRLKAAQAILDTALRYLEAHDFRKELDEFKARLDSEQQSKIGWS